MGVIYKIEHYLIIFMVNYNKAEWSADDNVIPLIPLKYANTDYPCY